MLAVAVVPPVTVITGAVVSWTVTTRMALLALTPSVEP